MPKNPVLVPSNGYRKAVVRYCTERLREIEGRLEHATGPRFEMQLQSCEDFAGVGRLILALQRRIVLRGGAVNNAWLEELSQLPSADIDSRAVELTRKVKHRLRLLCESAPYPTEPTHLLGTAVMRGGDSTVNTGACRGHIIEHDHTTGFRVQYADGDCEDLTFREVRLHILRAERGGSGRGGGGEVAGGAACAAAAAVAAAAAGTATVAVAALGGGTRSWDKATPHSMVEAEEPLTADDVCVQAIFERFQQRHKAEPATNLASASTSLASDARNTAQSASSAKPFASSVPAATGGGDRKKASAKATVSGSSWRGGGVSSHQAGTQAAQRPTDGPAGVLPSGEPPLEPRKRPRSRIAEVVDAGADGTTTSTANTAGAAVGAAVGVAVDAAMGAAVSAAVGAAVGAAGSAEALAKALPEYGLSLDEVAAAAVGPRKKVPCSNPLSTIPPP